MDNGWSHRPGSILLVVHTFYEQQGEEIIRIISARAAESHERRAYEEAHKRSEEHTSELQSRLHLVCRLLLEKKKKKKISIISSASIKRNSIWHCQSSHQIRSIH